MINLKTIALSAIAGFALIGGLSLATQLVTGETTFAQSTSAKSIVDDAISKGIIGETASGYLAPTSGSTSAYILDAMNEVNAGRKSVYTKLAREQNVQIEVVAALTGEKQLAKSAPGTMIMTKQGTWIKVR